MVVRFSRRDFLLDAEFLSNSLFLIFIFIWHADC